MLSKFLTINQITIVMKQARKQIMEQSKSRKAHVTKINNFEYKVNQDVFSPQLFSSTNFILPHIPSLGGIIVEVGTGCGTLVIDSILSGKYQKGLAGDIFSGAVQNAKENAKNLGVQDKIQFFTSDVLDSIPQTKADLLLWNYPFHAADQNQNRENISYFEKTLFDPGMTGFKKYIQARPKFLKKDGTMMISMSPDLSAKQKMENILKENNLKFEQVAKGIFAYSVSLMKIVPIQ